MDPLFGAEWEICTEQQQCSDGKKTALPAASKLLHEEEGADNDEAAVMMNLGVINPFELLPNELLCLIFHVAPSAAKCVPKVEPPAGAAAFFIGGHSPPEEKKERCICMFVCIFCQPGGPLMPSMGKKSQ